MTERNKVGEADPETRRKRLREILDSERGSGQLSDREQRKVKKKSRAMGLGDALDPNKKRERRYGPQGETVDEAVDRAVKGAKLSY